MRIKLGTNRFVILTMTKAIRIARIRPVRFILRMITFPFTSKSNHEQYYRKYGTSFLASIIRYIFFGIYANRFEYKYSNDYPTDDRIVHTEKLYAWGMIAIQTRGEEVSPETFKELNPFKKYITNRFQEVHGYWNFCMINGKLLLVDYGNFETCSFLKESKS